MDEFVRLRRNNGGNGTFEQPGKEADGTQDNELQMPAAKNKTKTRQVGVLMLLGKNFYKGPLWLRVFHPNLMGQKLAP